VSSKRPVRAPNVTAVLLLAAATCGLACEAQREPVQVTRAGIVYGDDDRQEYYELEGDPAATMVASSMAALVPKRFLGPQGLNASVPTLGDAQGLCAGEPFADQPSVALCSAVLLDSDLLLTAGHCVRALPLDDLVAAFGYYYQTPDRLALDSTAVFEVEEIVAEALDPVGTQPRMDYAWLRLRHPALAPRAPARIRSHPVAIAEPLVAIGAGSGVPMKIDRGASVRNAGQPVDGYFIADSDSSRGASGGGAFDDRLELLGILARGGPDFQLDPTANCRRSVVAEADGSDPSEQYTYAGQALAALCAKRPEVTSLCRPSCGDPCKASPPALQCSAVPGTRRHSGSNVSTWLLAYYGWRLRRRRVNSTGTPVAPEEARAG
jgi:hypothetical protein